ncbi:MAG: glycosyltransferase family 39 protein, partial [Methanobacterium paludis]|nr:glycosyltransferase family 39 protein [Methanobacterium paludis]
MDNYDKSFEKKFGKLYSALKRYSPYISLILLTLIVSVITYYRVLIQMDIGPLSDSCDFLSNALVYAGQGMGYSDLMRPPLFSFITSLVFRLGYVSTNTIFVMDGVLFVFGVIGFYLLLKLRFNDIESFLGALIYSTFPIVLAVLGCGFSDLASVSFTIWTLYFLVSAVKKNSKFFYLVFPFAMFAFLARYNSALIIFPIALYILMNKNKTNFKNIFIGIFCAILAIIPVFIFFYEKFGNIIYPFMSFFGATSSSVPLSPENASYNSNLLYFVDKFPAFIGFDGVLIILIIVVGILIYHALKLIRRSKDKSQLFNRLHVENATKIKLIPLVFLALLFVGTFGKIFYMLSEVIFFAAAYMFYDLSKGINIKDMDLHILFFAWFMAFFIFHSVYVIKDNRYFVLMAPAVAYFLILGLSGVSNRLKFKIKNRNITFPVIALVLTFILLLSTASYLPIVQQANNDTKITDENIIIASEWLANYDPDYKNKTIYSDLWPYFGWYLRTNVKMVPVFKDNQSYSGGVGGIKNQTFNQNDIRALNNYLNSNNLDYYLSVRQDFNLTSYKPVKQFGNLIVYE